MKTLATAAAILLSAWAFFIGLGPQPIKSERVLQESGYTEIEVGRGLRIQCSDSDLFATHFTAKSPSGAQVQGVVCGGLAKSSTIRLN